MYRYEWRFLLIHNLVVQMQCIVTLIAALINFLINDLTDNRPTVLGKNYTELVPQTYKSKYNKNL